MYCETSSSPPSYSCLNEKEPPLKIVKWVYDSPTKMSPSSPPVEEHRNLVVPDTLEEVLATRAKKTLKNALDDCKTFMFMLFYFIAENNRIFGL